jgi:hypothetical protein
MHVFFRGEGGQDSLHKEARPKNVLYSLHCILRILNCLHILIIFSSIHNLKVVLSFISLLTAWGVTEIRISHLRVLRNLSLPVWCGSMSKIHAKCVPRQHDMTRPQVTDGSGGLQIWRVAANIFNKHSRTTDMGCFSSLGVEHGAKNLQ